MRFDRRKTEKRKPLSSSFFTPEGRIKKASEDSSVLRRKLRLDYITDKVYVSRFIQIPEQNIKVGLATLVKEGSITEGLARKVFYELKRFRFANGRIITKKEFSEMPIMEKFPILAEKIKLVKDPETFEKILDFVNEHYESNPSALLNVSEIRKKFPNV